MASGQVIELLNGLRIGLSVSDPTCTFCLSEAPAPQPWVVPVPSVDEAFAIIEKAVISAPLATAVADQVLRVTPDLTVTDGLVVESLAYSMLQAGPEFQRWLASRTSRTPALDPDPVRLHRDGDCLEVLLDRPAKHNALNRAMRDSLLSALDIVDACPELSVTLRGSGPSFCSGGDLEEFGQFVDPATAHQVRLMLSIGARLAPVASRVTARVHGYVGGSGLELAAFCSRVISSPDAVFFLPEIGLGLIPGAGGTVSVTRRIGRWRTAYLLLSGSHLDAATALDWGLVDAIE